MHIPNLPSMVCRHHVLAFEKTARTSALLHRMAVPSRNAHCRSDDARSSIVAASPQLKRARAGHSTERHTNRHWVRRHGLVNNIWRLLVNVTQCRVRRTVTTASSHGRTKKQLSLSKHVSWTQPDVGFAEQRIGDKIGIHLDAEAARIVKISSRHSRTLTHELVGKEEASPGCRVHRPNQQERQNRVVPIRVKKWCPVDIKEGEGSWTPPAAVQQPRSRACPFATTRLPTIRSRTSSAV